MILILLVIPAIYFSFLSFVEVYKAVDKKNRVHKTKIALYLILVSFILILFANIFAFDATESNFGTSYWLTATIYYLLVSMMSGYVFLVIKRSRSRKNITKLTLTIFTILLYVPVIVWMSRVYSVGIYSGKFGTSAKYAKKIVDQNINPRVNHNVISSYRVGDNWNVKVDFISRDGEIKVTKNYRVGINDGKIIKEGKAVKFSVTKSLMPIDDAEIILFSSNSGQTQNSYDWDKIDYMKSDENGVAETDIDIKDNVYYFVQIKDCSLACQSVYYKLGEPIKGEYRIEYNPLQYNVVEI
ncbi:MAG: hypothetical protein BWY19_00156 [bacterium ADurb.Bin212]|nr:MAG: hypothetical protein BWY19_00156 [bacterium ADurb.Bin212]